MQAEYNYKPDEITYMKLPDGRADVWLRTNITEITDNDGNTVWMCEEVSFRTSLSQTDIVENFDTIFENGSPVIDDETQKEVADGVTTADRLDALEEGVLEIAEILTELME